MSARVTAMVVCCFLMQILCVVSQKASASGRLRPPDFLPGLCPGPRWGTSVPQTPSLPLCPPPNNPVRSTPLSHTHSLTYLSFTHMHTCTHTDISLYTDTFSTSCNGTHRNNSVSALHNAHCSNICCSVMMEISHSNVV